VRVRRASPRDLNALTASVEATRQAGTNEAATPTVTSNAVAEMNVSASSDVMPKSIAVMARPITSAAMPPKAAPIPINRTRAICTRCWSASAILHSSSVVIR